MSSGRAWGALALIVASALGGCAMPVRSPSASPASTGASSAPVAAAAGLREVAVAELVVGEAGADPIRVTPGTLHEGDLVWVLRADDADRASHLVAAATEIVDEATLPFGWVPVEVDGTPSLRPAQIECPAPPSSVESLAAAGPFGGLACYSAHPITFVGFMPIGCGAGGSPRTGTPDWLNGTWTAIGIGNREPTPPDFEVDAALIARAAPDLGLQPCGNAGWYRFVGHFDDPASSTCATETTTPNGAEAITLEPLLSQLLCRTQLVLTEATRVEPPR